MSFVEAFAKGLTLVKILTGSLRILKDLQGPAKDP